MNADGGVALLQEFPDAHDRAAGANAGDEGLRLLCDGNHLRPDFRAGGFFVGLDIREVGELAGEEDVLARGGQLFAHADAAEESALRGGNGYNFGAVAANELRALLAHPVGHEDLDRVAQDAAERRKGNAGVAAGGLGDGEAGLDLPFLIGLLQDAQGHAVLDAAGEIHVFGFGVKNAFAALIAEVDADEGGVADETSQRLELRCGTIDEYGHTNSLSHVWGNSASALGTVKRTAAGVESFEGDGGGVQDQPPSTVNSCAVHMRLASEARNRARLATSAGSMRAWRHCPAITSRSICGFSHSCFWRSVQTAPGRMVFTRMPAWPK